MEQQLTLLYKEKKENQEYYTFKIGKEIISLDFKDACMLICKYSSKNRNCKISKNQISLKSGEGNIRVKMEKGAKVKGVHFYTEKKFENKCTFLSNDLWFSSILTKKNHVVFLKKYSKYFKLVENAVMDELNPYKIITPFGVTDIDNISTGLKTIFIILYIKEFGDKNELYLVNVDECGDNALKFIYPLVKDTNIRLYIRHDIIDMPENYKYYVNGKRLNDTLEFGNYIY